MERLDPSARRDAFGSKINRDHSPMLVYAVPWISIMLGALAPMLPVISPAPVLPPIAYMMLLAWRLMRPGLLPLWAGLPLGLVDDLYSGQPIGSGILLFSITLIALEIIEERFPWRGFWLDWFVASIFIVVYIAAAALISGADLTFIQLGVIVPQLVISIIMFPIIARFVAVLDRVRLMRVRRLG